MSDIMRRASTIYDASYPPAVLAPDPHITTLVPSTASAAGGPVTVQVNGTDFLPTAVVEINQAAQPTTYVSATRLTVSYDPSAAATAQFTVRQDPHESNSVAFTVTALAAEDVSASTIEEIKMLVTDHPELRDEVRQLEADDKARSGLLTWLDDEATVPPPPEPQPGEAPQPGEPQPEEPRQPRPEPQPGEDEDDR
jgi:IPT/TIG domain